MTDTEFNSYFLDLATRLKDIAHQPEAKIGRFARMDEVLSTKRSALLLDPGLVVKNEAGSFDNIGNGNAIANHQCAFLVLQKCGIKDFDQYEKAFYLAMRIGNKILAKMLVDLKNNQGMMRYLDRHSIRFEKVGPVYDHAFGYAFHFSLKMKVGCEFVYNQNDWI